VEFQAKPKSRCALKVKGMSDSLEGKLKQALAFDEQEEVHEDAEVSKLRNLVERLKKENEELKRKSSVFKAVEQAKRKMDAEFRLVVKAMVDEKRRHWELRRSKSIISKRRHFWKRIANACALKTCKP